MDSLVALASSPAAWAALGTLIVMEIVLGIDNLIFVALVTNRVEAPRRPLARAIGIGLALVLRLALLGSAAWLVRLTTPVVTLFAHEFSWRDLVLIAGGLFLVYKATSEIRGTIEPEGGQETQVAAPLRFSAAISQIIMLDLVFSIDSIITAVGMTNEFAIMVIAVVIAVALMLAAAAPLSKFIHANPTIIMLALAFLMMIGMSLIADGFGVHVPKNYIYAAMGFSAGVEALNRVARRGRGGRR